MLENFTELFQQTLSQDEMSLTEKLEEKNSSNSNERHLLEYEESNTETVTKVGLDYSFTILVNSTTTWLIFNQLKYITPDFSGVFFHLFIVAVALLMNLPYLTEKTVNRKYLFILTTGRLIVAFTVNSRIINNIDNKVAKSKLAYEELRTEVKNYETGQSKDVTLLWGHADIVLPIVGGLFIIWVLRSLFTKKVEVSSNEDVR
jgi:hypothetical protein